MLFSIILKNDAITRLKKGELWFSEKDVHGLKPKIAGIARLLDRKKKFVAQAFLSPDSKYYLRIIAQKDENIDRDFWRAKIKKAYEKRADISRITNAFRVVHAESDGIPAVVIDKYNDIWSLQITSEAVLTITDDLAWIIKDEYFPLAIVDTGKEKKLLFGDKTMTTIQEDKMQFEVDVVAGQKTGAYLDYRAFRLKAKEFATGKCLDAFCYQGWFACQIAPCASTVTAIDSSSCAIEAANVNAQKNNLKNITFVKADVFDYLKESDEKFDFIHLDPPSFAKGHSNLNAAKVGYKKLLALAIARLAKGGKLLVSSCSHGITERVLEEIVQEAFTKASLFPKIIYRGIQDKDHPVLRGHPESLYLKAIAVEI